MCESHKVSLVTTPVTASSWRWQVHRRVQLHRPRTTEIQTKLASIQDNSLTICYQNSPCCVTSYRDRVSPRQASYLSCSHKKRNPKNATRLSASLRYVSLRSGQTCVTPFSLRCRPTRCAARRFAHTNGGKSVYEATLSCGSVARSPNSVPQALTHG